MKTGNYFPTIEETFLLDEIPPGQSVKYITDILIDADALVALVKTDDSNHQKAIRISQLLQKNGCTWYVSPYTISEVVTVISYKISHSVAKNVLQQIRKLVLNPLSLKDHSGLADKWFLKQNKKDTSYFDCYNMALLERYKKQLNGRIFSFDAIYKRNGFKLVGDENVV